MAAPEFDIVVIGGGAGGLVVAAGGAALGAKVALVEAHKLGGDCLWRGCVPSKTLLASARIAHQMRHADRWAVLPADPQPELAQVMARVASVIAGIAPGDSPERFRGLGVDVTFGTGSFVAPDAFEVAGRRLTARTFVIATGSRPVVPPIPGLAAVPFLTNETLFELREPVPHLLVIGAGPVGCEMAQAFSRLGSRVTLVDAAPQLLPHEDADLAAVVDKALRDEGVGIHLGAAIERVGGAAGDVRLTLRASDGTEGALAATHLLVATGRAPALAGLGLDAAGIRVEHGRIVVDPALRTTNRSVYVIGDAAGGRQFTHLAEHHAGIVLRHAVFRLRWTKPSPVIPWCTYTDPELAGVGLAEGDARRQGIDHRVYRFAFDEIDRARTDNETRGFAKLIADRKGRLLGAAIVGAHAGELIAECTLALGAGMRIDHLSGAVHAYPTLALAIRRAADRRQKERLTPSSQRWIKRLFGLRGT